MPSDLWPVLSPRLPLTNILFVVADVESSAEDVIELPIDKGVAGKEVTACFSKLQTYRREEVWLAIFQVDEVQNPSAPFCGDVKMTCQSLYE